MWRHVTVKNRAWFTSHCCGLFSSVAAEWQRQGHKAVLSFFIILTHILRRMCKKQSSEYKTFSWSTCLKFPDFNNQTNDDFHKEKGQTAQDRTRKLSYSITVFCRKDHSGWMLLPWKAWDQAMLKKIKKIESYFYLCCPRHHVAHCCLLKKRSKNNTCLDFTVIDLHHNYICQCFNSHVCLCCERTIMEIQNKHKWQRMTRQDFRKILPLTSKRTTLKVRFPLV